MAAKKSTLSKLFAIVNVTAIASSITAMVAFAMAYWNINVLHDTFERDRKLDWQKTLVYSIIEDGFLIENKGQSGLTFAQIQERYRKKVGDQITFYKQFKLSAQDLDDTTLRRLLLELQAASQVNYHSNKTYSVALFLLNPRSERSLVETEIKYAILNVLTIDKGKYTAEELRFRIDKRFTSDQEGYNFVINYLFSQNMIVADFDKENKSRKVLYTIANCPRCPFVSEIISAPKGEPIAPPVKPDDNPKKKTGSKVECCGNGSTAE